METGNDNGPPPGKPTWWLPVVLLAFFLAGSVPLVVNAIRDLSGRNLVQGDQRGIYVEVRDEILPAVSIPLPQFDLIDERGVPFTREDMKGGIWLADFVFTRCPGPCLVMTQRMARWQEKLAGLGEVRIVSFTVDPEYDSPEVLAAYASRFGARDGRWKFVTGPPDEQMELVRDGFKLVVAEQEDEELARTEGDIIHSTRIVLVDADAVIRGYYDSASEEAMAKLAQDVGILRESMGKGE